MPSNSALSFSPSTCASMYIMDLQVKELTVTFGRYRELALSNSCNVGALGSSFLSLSLGMPLGLNTADKVAVRGQNNSKAPYDFAV